MKNFWRKKLPSFLLALLMVATLVPTAGAASADIEETVEAGEEVALSRTDFKNVFDAGSTKSNESLSYVVFENAGRLDDYGYFTAYDYYDDVCELDEDKLEADAYFYYNASEVPKNIDYALSGLTFVANRNADDGTIYMSFTAVGTKNSKVDGTLEITVDGDGRSSSNADVTYEVDAGDRVTFDIADFAALKSFDYLVFTDYSDLDAYGYFTAYDNDDDKVTLTERNFGNNRWFYYDEDDLYDADHDGDCDLDTLTFIADDDADGVLTLEFELYNNSGTKRYSGTVEIEVGEDSSSSSSKVDGDIVYEMDENDDISFDPDDFKKFFEKTYNNFSCIRFTDITNLDDCGVLTTYTYDDRSEDWDAVELDEDDALDGYFYYDDDDVEDAADQYCLDGLGFDAEDDTDGEVVVLEFTAYGTSSSRKVNGTLVIEIGDVKSSSSSKSDIEYEAAPKEEVVFDEEDFNDFFQENYSSYDFKYLYFTDSTNLGTYNGFMYYKYGRSSEERFSTSSLENAYFYYDEDEIPEDEDNCYPLEDLSFVASEYFDTEVTLDFTAYYSSSRQVDGTVTITPSDKKAPDAPQTSSVTSSILYTTTTGNKVQLKANDFVRFYESKIGNSTLQSVKLMGVPTTGGLYYNYYKASSYGTAAQLPLTAYNCTTLPLYVSPANNTQYALTELTYVPSGTNYCASIPFAASGTGGFTVYGTVTISVTNKAIPEVYGVTPKNTAVSFPAPAISSAVSTGTSSTLAGIQLLKLPASNVGAVYVGTTNARAATTSDLYTVSGGNWTISQLRFVPASGYTGNVEIPYAAYDSAGKTIGVGKFSLGIVNKQVKFSDVSSSTWCYKYVAEMSDANIISGYSNSTFKPNNTISYGAALKLIMLAAGYPEQAPTVAGSPFSGYLAKAKADGLVTRSNVNLSAPITRLQVAQLAAGAMKLDLDNLSSVKPFTDTTDKHVQALNAAGIVEGYFSNGTSTYKPGNTLTRGQVSAIVWRMQNYQ